LELWLERIGRDAVNGQPQLQDRGDLKGGRVDGLAASGVDWEQVTAVKLLGVALAALFLLWAIRRMFGGKR
jgi:hypothetical protein